MTMRKKCLYSELFWSVFLALGLNAERYSVAVQMWETVDQNNPEHGHFSRSQGELK